MLAGHPKKKFHFLWPWKQRKRYVQIISKFEIGQQLDEQITTERSARENEENENPKRRKNFNILKNLSKEGRSAALHWAYRAEEL